MVSLAAPHARCFGALPPPSADCATLPTPPSSLPHLISPRSTRSRSRCSCILPSSALTQLQPALPQGARVNLSSLSRLSTPSLTPDLAGGQGPPRPPLLVPQLPVPGRDAQPLRLQARPHRRGKVSPPSAPLLPHCSLVSERDPDLDALPPPLSRARSHRETAGVTQDLDTDPTLVRPWPSAVTDGRDVSLTGVLRLVLCAAAEQHRVPKVVRGRPQGLDGWPLRGDSVSRLDGRSRPVPPPPCASQPQHRVRLLLRSLLRTQRALTSLDIVCAGASSLATKVGEPRRP